ncbi:unnamed protein product [Schistocephalus solidus]|uniref:Uncharacterized protein n=1 Tax=Schistocephalus solidus TaxID=70667 RepID=A0A183SEJ8_SCHSO|nr:unnamed protein product [Schistocephalus solidus]
MLLRVLADREVKNDASRTLKKSLKQLQINPATWKDLAQDRLAWRRSVKTGSAINEANRIAAAKAKRAARKSPAPRNNTVDAQALPTCPRYQRIFRARITLVGHFRTQCTNNPTIPTSTSNSTNPPSNSPTLTPGINSITPTIIETTSQYSSPVTPTTAFAFATTTTISDGDSIPLYPASTAISPPRTPEPGVMTESRRPEAGEGAGGSRGRGP